MRETKNLRHRNTDTTNTRSPIESRKLIYEIQENWISRFEGKTEHEI